LTLLPELSTTVSHRGAVREYVLSGTPWEARGTPYLGTWEAYREVYSPTMGTQEAYRVVYFSF